MLLSFKAIGQVVMKVNNKYLLIFDNSQIFVDIFLDTLLI